jgi:hypothetical protein
VDSKEMVEKIRGDTVNKNKQSQSEKPDESKIMQDASDQPARSPYGEIN